MEQTPKEFILAKGPQHNRLRRLIHKQEINQDQQLDQHLQQQANIEGEIQECAQEELECRESIEKIQEQEMEIGRIDQETEYKLLIRNDTQMRIKRLVCIDILGDLIKEEGEGGLVKYENKLERESQHDIRDINLMTQLLDTFYQNTPDITSHLDSILKEFNRIKIQNSTYNNQFEYLNANKKKQLCILNALDNELTECAKMLQDQDQYQPEDDQPPPIQTIRIQRIDYTPLIINRQSLILSLFYAFHQQLQKINRLIQLILTKNNKHLVPFPKQFLDTADQTETFVSDNKYGIFRKNLERMGLQEIDFDSIAQKQTTKGKYQHSVLDNSKRLQQKETQQALNASVKQFLKISQSYGRDIHPFLVATQDQNRQLFDQQIGQGYETERQLFLGLFQNDLFLQMFTDSQQRLLLMNNIKQQHTSNKQSLHWIVCEMISGLKDKSRHQVDTQLIQMFTIYQQVLTAAYQAMQQIQHNIKDNNPQTKQQYQTNQNREYLKRSHKRIAELGSQVKSNSMESALSSVEDEQNEQNEQAEIVKTQGENRKVYEEMPNEEQKGKNKYSLIYRYQIAKPSLRMKSQKKEELATIIKTVSKQKSLKQKSVLDLETIKYNYNDKVQKIFMTTPGGYQSQLPNVRLYSSQTKNNFNHPHSMNRNNQTNQSMQMDKTGDRDKRGRNYRLYSNKGPTRSNRYQSLGKSIVQNNQSMCQ